MIRDMTFDGGKNYETMLLVTPKDFKREKLEEVFVRPLDKLGVPANTILAVELAMPKGKVTAAQAKQFLEALRAPTEALGIKRIILTQGQYFKTLCGLKKVGQPYGRPMESKYKIPVFYSPSASQVYFDPQVAQNIELALGGVHDHHFGNESKFDIDLSENVETPLGIFNIHQHLMAALEWDNVYIDVETNGLELGSGITSVSISPDKDSAVAFPSYPGGEFKVEMKEFILNSKGTMCFHNSPFDCKQLIWELFMEDSFDPKGMVDGVEVMFQDTDDTKILAYCALNNTAKAELSLKTLAYEYTGDYAVDFDQIVHGTEKMLQYNGIDTMATAYVKEKYREQVREEQEYVYKDVLMPSQKTITLMELTGMPLNFATVLRVEQELKKVQVAAVDKITNHVETKKALRRIREHEAIKANAKLKKLRKTWKDFQHVEFNPRSGNHLRVLLYEVLEMEILKTTDSGLASTTADALKQMEQLLTPQNDPRAELIHAIRDLQEVAIINSTFIPAFKNKSMWKSDGWRYLLGSFNLGGTVSGRLSSSNPNLQNIPSTGTRYAKAIKSCFEAPPGWLIVGADYFSLEDRISALQTKDPNKLAVYTEGYDGHSLRAYSYFRDQMPDITQELEDNPDNQVAIINSIEKRYKPLRQLSKGPTFALTYMGTWKTLVETFGLSKAEAKKIEEEYHKLYKVSDDWVSEQIRKAQQTGYVELAFGLRLRTPSLPRCLDIKQKDKLPYEAYSEMKTAGNALGQSYGLLNSFSANMFMERVWASEYKYDILPIAQIHDSQYYMIKNTLGHIKFVNDNLVECMEWCELPAIKHEEVGLGSSLEIFWPTWADVIEIPNRASLAQIQQCITTELKRRKEDAKDT